MHFISLMHANTHPIHTGASATTTTPKRALPICGLRQPRRTSGLGALSRVQRPERIRELTAMFTEIRRAHPEAEAFAGGSWLYNLPAYQALFPPEYIATMNPTRPRFTYMDVWGAIPEQEVGCKSGLEPGVRCEHRPVNEPYRSGSQLTVLPNAGPSAYSISPTPSTTSSEGPRLRWRKRLGKGVIGDHASCAGAFPGGDRCTDRTLLGSRKSEQHSDQLGLDAARHRCSRRTRCERANRDTRHCPGY